MRIQTRKNIIVFLMLSLMVVGSEYISAQSNSIHTLHLGYNPVEGSIYYYRLVRMIDELKKRSGVELKIISMPSKRG